MFPSKNYISFVFVRKEQKLWEIIKGSKIKIICSTKTEKKTNKI